MNRKNLTAAVLAGLAGAAGIAGTAQAVNINPDGLGQVLIYPYYTVNNDNNTLLSVVNTSEDAQAVKVRFLEGQNSREVLDFNLYLSKYDVWVGAVIKKDVVDDEGNVLQAGVPHLMSSDNSCTVPYLYRDFPVQPFLNLALNDGGSTDISGRGTEGYVEVISMGKVTDDVKGTATAVTHATNATTGVWEPADCQQLINAWTDNTDPTKKGYWILDWDATGGKVDSYGYTDIDAPQGGLFGGGSIVNVPNGTLFTYDARAINGFDDGHGTGEGGLHARPGLIEPNLASGNQDTGYVFLGDGSPAEDTFVQTIDAVSYVFMHDAVMNEYITLKSPEGDPAGETEWVVTMPTKSFYVHADCGVDNTGTPITGNCLDAPIRPFTDLWDDETNTGACEPVTLASVWDQDERSLEGDDSTPGKPIPPVVSPSLPGSFGGTPTIGFELCYEAQVIRFGTYAGAELDPPADYAGPTEILGSNNVVNFDNEVLGFEAGWARIDLHNYRIDDDGVAGVADGVINEDDTPRRREGLIGSQNDGLTGLPVTGFAVNRFQNGFLDGGHTLANYGGIFSHKATRGFCGSYTTGEATEGDGFCDGGILARKPVVVDP